MGVSPDLSSPGGSATAGGLAAFAAKDAETWKNEYANNPVASAFGPIGVIFGEAMEWVNAVIQALGLNFQPLLDKIQDVFDDIVNPDWLGDITDWSSLFDVLGNIGDTITVLVDALLGALGIPALGDIGDRISDLADEVSSWFDDTLDMASDLADLVWNLLNDPIEVLGQIPQVLVSGLSSTLNQIEDVFNGLVVTPVNTIVGAISSWFNTWFGGGSNNAIPMSMRGANNGVAPLNGSGKLATSFLVTDTASNVPTLDGGGKIKSAQLPDFSSSYLAVGTRGAANGVAPLNGGAVVPLANLPEEVGGMGGSGFGLPYVTLYITSPINIPKNSNVVVAGWSQVGTTSVTLDGSAARWRFGLDGLWQIVAYCNWDDNSAGIRALALNREIVLDTGTPAPFDDFHASDSRPAAALSMDGSSAPQSAAVLNARVGDWEVSYPGGVAYFGSDDWFSLVLRQNSGGTRTAQASHIAGVRGTAVTCVYLGAA